MSAPKVVRSGGTQGCAECLVPRVDCSECGRPIADAHDEVNHNTGECGCTQSRALCWRQWNGDKCCAESPYAPASRAAIPSGEKGRAT